jgi:cytochrome oxidase Cu insertion factor (SCO1/SenC/PrrC family)
MPTSPDQQPDISGPKKPVDAGRLRAGWLPWLIIVSGIVIAALVVIAISDQPARSKSQDSLPISNEMSTLLEVNPLMILNTPAPTFALTDQHGNHVSLDAFRGKSVVLTFGDDQCTDLCTLLAEDVIAADKDLGGASDQVQFVSINANTFYPSVSTTRKWTDQHGLAHVKNWHFLTGSPATLTKLAKTYGVTVELDKKQKTIVHGAEMFFIDPAGKEVQIGEFGVQSANTALFSHAMAQLATDTLGTADRHPVAGPTGGHAATVKTTLGSIPPPVTLPTLGSTVPTSTASYRGRYLVMNFWSSTCTACVAELPALQKTTVNLQGKAALVGIDVSDTVGAASAFVTKAGTSYPMLVDRSGAIAGQYQLTGLPYTVILDPKGKVVVRHPGAITAEQAEYLVQTLTAQASDG